MAEQMPKKPLSVVLWWLCFGISTYVMSLWFQAFRDFTETPSMQNGLNWLGVLALLLLTVSILLYDSYAQERNRGRVAHPVRVFEWLYRRQYPGDSK